MNDHRFAHTDIHLMKLSAWINANPTLLNVVQKNITTAFLNEIMHRSQPENEQHTVIQIWGETGSKKSSAAQEIAHIINPHHTEKHIVFTNQQIEKVMQDTQPGDVIIRDESPHDYGMGSRRITTTVEEYAETLRKNRISLIFIRPTLQINEAAHFHLRTIDEHANGCHIRLALYDPHSNTYLGGITLPIRKNNPTWKKYLDKKNTFLDAIRQANLHTFDIDQATKEMIQDPKLKTYNNKKERRVYVYKNYPRLTTQQHDLLCTALEHAIREQN